MSGQEPHPSPADLRSELERQIQVGLDQGFARLNETLERTLRRLFERDSTHLTWTKETAKLVSKLRDEVLAGHQQTVAQRVDALVSFLSGRDHSHLEWTKETAKLVSRLRDDTVAGQRALQSAIMERESRLVERDKAQLEWAKQIAKLVSDVRDHELAKVIASLENFDHRLTADLRARLAHQALEDARQPAPAPGAGRGAAPDEAAEGGAGSSLVDERRFGLLRPTVHPELEGLLGLGVWTADDQKTAVYLSRMANETLRSIYPANERRPGKIVCRSGLQLEADLSDIFAANAAFGWLQEADDFALFMALVTPGATVVDVGANFGLYAAHAALYGGPGAHVVAFEPGPDTFALLTDNIARNGLADRCRCIQAAVAGKAGKAEFNVASDGAFSGLRDTGRSRSVGVIQTEVVTLDGLPALKDLPPVDLIKIDVEGGEGAVLAGARRLFSRSPNLVAMLEFSHKNLDAAGRRKVLGELGRLEADGFAILSRDPDGPGMATIGLEGLQTGRSENLFLCRPASPMMRRLKDLAGSLQTRVITPIEAAALALLKRQASAGAASAL